MSQLLSIYQCNLHWWAQCEQPLGQVLLSITASHLFHLVKETKWSFWRNVNNSLMDNQSATFWSKQEEEIWQDILGGRTIFKCFLKEHFNGCGFKTLGWSGHERKWRGEVKQSPSCGQSLRNYDYKLVTCCVKEAWTILGEESQSWWESQL